MKTHKSPPHPKIKTLTSVQTHRLACYSLSISSVISLSSAREISSMIKNNTKQNMFSATSGMVSVSTITLIRKKKGPLLLHQAPYRSLTLHHASNLLLACEAATAHHAILVPALYMRFTVSSFPHFLPAVRGRLNSLSSPLTLRTTLFSLEIHLLYPHYLTFFFKLIKKVEKKRILLP